MVQAVTGDSKEEVMIFCDRQTDRQTLHHYIYIIITIIIAIIAVVVNTKLHRVVTIVIVVMAIIINTKQRSHCSSVILIRQELLIRIIVNMIIKHDDQYTNVDHQTW